MLLIGIITSVFTAVNVTRMMVALWVSASARAHQYLREQNMKLLKLVPDNTNIDFMSWRNVALVLSIIATVASLALVASRGLNLGVDFVGGQIVRATFAQPPDLDDLRDKVDTPERRRGQHPGVRRQQNLSDPPAQPEGGGGGKPGRRPRSAR